MDFASIKHRIVFCGILHFFLFSIISVLLIIAIPACAGALVIPNYPLLGGSVTTTPNVLVLYDNSFSMDGELNPSYFFIGGNDPKSRSNIARTALRSIMTSYSSQFNWGIETFETYGSSNCVDNNGRCSIYTDYQGDNTTMVFTNDCVNGVSASHGGLGCIPNPEPNNGYNYVTYAEGQVGNSAYLVGSFYKGWAWGMYAAGDYSGYLIDVFDHHNSVSTWTISNDNNTVFGLNNDFKDPSMGAGTNYHNWSGCIDAGSGNCVGHKQPRLLFINDGWVFMQNFTGYGKIIEPISSNATAGHNTNLMNAIAPETSDLNSTEIKNGSFQTPLMGSFITAKNYFSGAIAGVSSPIQNSCQKNFVLLATDGQPTADATGYVYSPAEIGDATTGKAYTDLYPQIQALRSLSYGGYTYDIQTYILGMGDITSNSVAVNGLNKMAQYGGTNQAYLANDLDSMKNAFQTIANSIGVTIPLRQSNGHIAVSATPIIQNSQVYKASFANPSSNIWEGNITKGAPNYSTASNGLITYDTGGITGFDTGAAKWLQSDTVNGVARQIITAMRPSSTGSITGSPFVWASLNNYTQGLLMTSGETTTLGSQRLSYLRGDRTNEVSANNANGFRARDVTVLGDIIDSSPVYVGPSISGFSDSDFSTTTTFSSFSQSVANRRAMVYVGANDGMLHGFDANTLQEVFAFIPNSVFPKIKRLSDRDYGHEFFVNETPIVTETQVTGRGWVTELIGFPGMGGTGLFALDVTSPDGRRTNVDLPHAENNASNILLWELNSQTDSDVGYILNRGQINRNRSGLSMQIGKVSNGRWAIIAGNGYNSPNNSTGLLVVYLDTAGGTPTYKKVMISGATGGLSTPTPVDVDFDGVIDYAYAGDLQGNVWRFDLRGADTTWQAVKLFQATTGTGSSAKLSPITTAPAVMNHCSQPGLLVFVGTGKYIESTDNNANYADNHVDYLYGLWDKMDSSTIQTQDLVTQSYLQGTYTNSSSAPDVAKSLLLTTDNTVDWASGKRGWMLQLYNQYPQAARIVVPPYVMNDKLYFNTISPNTATCQASTSWGTAQALQACTGQRPSTGVFDTNYDGKTDNSDQYNLNGTPVNVTGINTKDLGRIIDSSIWISPKAMTCTTPPLCSTVQTGFNDLIGLNLSSTPAHRQSWREVTPNF